MTPKDDTLAYQVIGCAMEVYKNLGPGLLKSVAKLEDIHYKQLLNYLLLADKPLGYLINFNVPNFTLGQGYDKIRNLRYNKPIPDWVI